ncbi:MAG: hypothetical protein SFX18_14825 [Pirellulales bacterium]|nr:hypothetical protein [Pirellulales bacterium]
MNQAEILLRVIDALEIVGIPYVLFGSFASNVYGIMRATLDADIVIQTAHGQHTTLRTALLPEFSIDPQMQFETVSGTVKTAVTHNATVFLIELFELSADPHDQARFARRQKLPLENRDVYVLTPEDVLVTKLNWLQIANRGKDLADIKGVIAVQGDALDWPYIENWCEYHDSQRLLEKIRAELSQK